MRNIVLNLQTLNLKRKNCYWFLICYMLIQIVLKEESNDYKNIGITLKAFLLKYTILTKYITSKSLH